MKKILIAFLILLFAVSAWGQYIYEWQDADGNKHFTDDYNECQRKMGEVEDELKQRAVGKEKAVKAKTEKEKKQAELIAKNTQQVYNALGSSKDSNSERFSVYSDGVVEDTRTGLMWTLLNSELELYVPMTYQQATWYVKGLKTGGYTDWRLPTVQELAMFYCEEPAYPSMGAQWFWSSQLYQRGKHDLCRVVVPRKFGEDYKKIFERGAVHAVRP